jgi:hypothetical protein
VSRRFFTTCCVIVDAPCLVWPEQVREERAQHALVVDAAVLPEVRVLGDDERVDQPLGQVVVRDHRAALGVELAEQLVAVRAARDDARDLLRLVVAQRVHGRQARVARVDPEGQRDGDRSDGGEREAEQRAPLEESLHAGPRAPCALLGLLAERGFHRSSVPGASGGPAQG